MKKWEYWAINSMWLSGGIRTDNPEIIYFTEEGIQNTKLDRKNKVINVSKAIALLGEQGWEMVGIVPSGNPWHSLYFKRPKE